MQDERISKTGACKDNKAIAENLNDLFQFVFDTVSHTEIVCDRDQLEETGHSVLKWDSNSEQK